MPTDSIQVLRRCPQCRENKPLDAFYGRGRKAGHTSPYCKVCTGIRVKEWRQKNPKRYRDGRRKMKYGLTPEAFAALLKKQEGGCAICGAVVSGNAMSDDLCIDHCHKTKKTRGLLCHACNCGLGHFNDDPVLLEKAIEYLKKHQ